MRRGLEGLLGTRQFGPQGAVEFLRSQAVLLGLNVGGETGLVQIVLTPRADALKKLTERISENRIGHQITPLLKKPPALAVTGLEKPPSTPPPEGSKGA